VPRGNTSNLPEEVTGLACREYAHQRYLDHVNQIERLDQLPGMNITTAQIGLAADRSRELLRDSENCQRNVRSAANTMW
jgi:hypothetical protein